MVGHIRIGVSRDRIQTQSTDFGYTQDQKQPINWTNSPIVTNRHNHMGQVKARLNWNTQNKIIYLSAGYMLPKIGYNKVITYRFELCSFPNVIFCTINPHKVSLIVLLNEATIIFLPEN